jgi:hypothetical protein
MTCGRFFHCGAIAQGSTLMIRPMEHFPIIVMLRRA